jgi:hypothetical protein
MSDTTQPNDLDLSELEAFAVPDHSAGVTDEIRAIIRRAHWQEAKTVEAVAPHQYVVRGWDKDDVTEAGFDLVAAAIKAHGRLEEWTPPAGFYDSGNRRPMQNRYLYIGDGYAYWFTRPRGRVSMLNRERTSVQLANPTRRVVGGTTSLATDPPARQLTLPDEGGRP